MSDEPRPQETPEPPEMAKWAQLAYHYRDDLVKPAVLAALVVVGFGSIYFGFWAGGREAEGQINALKERLNLANDRANSYTTRLHGATADQASEQIASLQDELEKAKSGSTAAKITKPKTYSSFDKQNIVALTKQIDSALDELQASYDEYSRNIRMQTQDMAPEITLKRLPTMFDHLAIFNRMISEVENSVEYRMYSEDISVIGLNDKGLIQNMLVAEDSVTAPLRELASLCENQNPRRCSLDQDSILSPVLTAFEEVPEWLGNRRQQLDKLRKSLPTSD